MRTDQQTETMELPLVAHNLLLMARGKREKGRADALIKAHTAAFEATFHLGARSVMFSARELVSDALCNALHYCDAAVFDLETDDDRAELARLVGYLRRHLASNENAMDHVRDDGKEPYQADEDDEKETN